MRLDLPALASPLRLALALGLTLVGFAAPAAAAPTPAEVGAAEADDLLGDLIVAASKRPTPALRLPKVGVEAPAEGALAGALAALVRRDLELSFEVDLVAAPAIAAAVADGGADEGAAATSAGFVDRWRGAGAEFVVRTSAEVSDAQTVLSVALVDLTEGDVPVFKRSISGGPELRARDVGHRLVDALLGALTGYSGPFASELAFVRTRGGERQIVTIDADGEGLRARSPAEQLALSPAFGPGHVLYWAASVDRGRYNLYRDGDPEPLRLEGAPRGSIYGVAFSEDRTKLALSLAADGGVRVYVGGVAEAPARAVEVRPLGASRDLALALHPVFTPRGGVAFAGSIGRRQRIYVDGRPASPRELSAAAPTLCRHPEGTRLVYAVVHGEREVLAVSDERGREAPHILRGGKRRSYPACSPDGRLVAFFSTGEGSAGPGLYLMRVDGRRPPRKIADATGDSLRWARIP
ncbi:MAG: hypothetical protein R3A79_07565 [Nannocystaceae bacterium]